MITTELLEKCIAGEVLKGDDVYLRFKDGQFQITSIRNDIRLGWIDANGYDIPSKTWYVVEPKSKIEEAIELGVARISGAKCGNRYIHDQFVYVANVALDEAIRAFKEWRRDDNDLRGTAIEVIQSLKLKE